MEVKFLLLCICGLQAISHSYAFIDGLYCGLENCYEVLNTDRDATKSDISKAYRRLARKWHPDMHKSQKAKEKATVQFQKIANAYEILTDEEQRKDYDHMLDNPDEFYSVYYRYYRRRYAPKVDVRVVIAVTLTVISVMQYLGQMSNYNTAIRYLIQQPKYRMRAMEIAKSEGLLQTDKKKQRGKSKEEIKEEEEAVLKKVLTEKMDIRGGYSKPDPYSVLWIQLILSPYNIIMYILWWGKWIWRFRIKKEEYGEEEKLYLIKSHMRKYSGLTNVQWESLEDYQKEDFLTRELWILEKFQEWKKIQDEESKAKLAESARYKSYRRFMKNHGVGQMTFGPE